MLARLMDHAPEANRLLDEFVVQKQLRLGKIECSAQNVLQDVKINGIGRSKSFDFTAFYWTLQGCDKSVLFLRSPLYCLRLDVESDAGGVGHDEFALPHFPSV